MTLLFHSESKDSLACELWENGTTDNHVILLAKFDISVAIIVYFANAIFPHNVFTVLVVTDYMVFTQYNIINLLSSPTHTP